MSIAKDDLHRLVEALPEKKIAAAKKLLESLLSQAGDPWTEFLKNPPIDDEPLTEDDLKAIEAAEKDIAEGKIQTLDEVAKGFGLCLERS